MRKLFLPLFLCLLFGGSSQAQDYVVQVAAFDTKVSLDYFKGLNGIYHVEDHNNIHKYYIGGFRDSLAANNKASDAKALGYKAYVIDLEAIRRMCANTCGAPILDAPPKIKSIFFDFDKSFLRSESKYQLDQLFGILKNNPQYSVELSAHTDSKGSLTYNEALSQRRANAAKTYLLGKGISADRIKVSTFGENAPIAKNELAGGKDTEEGRQFNRRVELIIHNRNGAVEPVVEEISVPPSLKQE